MEPSSIIQLKNIQSKGGTLRMKLIFLTLCQEKSEVMIILQMIKK